jgi:thiol:disulfide interchange protein
MRAMMWIGWAWLIAALLAWPGMAWGQLGAPADAVQVSTTWSSTHARPGDQRVLAVVVDIGDTYHINPDAAQAVGVEGWSPYPTRLTVTANDPAITIGPAQFPKPHALTVSYFTSPVMVYEHQAVIFVPVVINTDAAPGDRTLSVEVVYQACDDKVCFPPRTVQLDVTLQVVAADAAGETAGDVPSLFADFDASIFARMLGGVALPQVVAFDLFGLSFAIDAAGGVGFTLLLIVAAIGGLLLNFTPCVLPVIPIKIIGLSQAAGNRARCLLLGVSMSLGVVAFWLGLGAVLASVTGFDAVNKLFQYPTFTIAVGALIAVMAVGMCGLFAVRLPQAVYRVSPKHDSLPGSFAFGVMTAVLSTPCTAPFMGAAAGWSLTQSPLVVLTTFAAIGTGMAMPYMVLSAFPSLVNTMPRTGPASELIKQTMGLLMLAAAAYFIGVGVVTLMQTPPDPVSLAYWWVVAGFVIAAGGWLAYRTWGIARRIVPRAAWSAAGAAVILIGVWIGVRMTDRGPVNWVYYTQERFEAALAQGDVVVMDFTAEWCLNCKALEHSVLYTRRVSELLNARGVTPIKVDITSADNVEGNQMLSRMGRATIPLLVVFAPDGEGGREVFKSDAYTPDQVLRAVEEARAGRTVAMQP